MIWKRFWGRATTTSLRWNMISSALFWIINSLVSFVLIRIVLSYVSLSDYGYWAAFMALTSYFTLSDLGLGPTLTRYISDTKVDKNKKRGLITLMLSIEALSALLLGLILIGVYVVFYKNKLAIVFGLVLLAQFFTQLGMNLLAVLNGLQKIVLSNLVLISKTLIYFVITLFLIRKWGLLAMAIAFVIAGGWMVGVSLILVNRYFRLSFQTVKGLNKGFVKKALSFSGVVFVLKIIGQTRGQFDRILLSIAATPELTAIVDLARKLINPVRGVYVSVVSPVFPVFGQLYSAGDNNRLNQVLRKTLILGVGLLGGLLGGLALGVPWVIKLWLGYGFLQILPAVYILIVAEFLNLVMYPVNLKIIASKDQVKLAIFLGIITLIQLSLAFGALIYVDYLAMLKVIAGVELVKLVIWSFLFFDHFKGIFTTPS